MSEPEAMHAIQWMRRAVAQAREKACQECLAYERSLPLRFFGGVVPRTPKVVPSWIRKQMELYAALHVERAYLGWITSAIYQDSSSYVGKLEFLVEKLLSFSANYRSEVPALGFDSGERFAEWCAAMVGKNVVKLCDTILQGES